MTVRVLIVDDHDLLAQSLGYALGAAGYHVERLAAPDMAAITAAAERFEPAVVLLDLHLGAAGDAVGVIRPLCRTGATVVVMTAETDRGWLGACVEAGAAGVVSKADPFTDLLTAVEGAASGQPLLPLSERKALLAALQHQRAEEARRDAAFRFLTPRERAVLAALMEGKTAETIAQESFVSVATVRSHIRSLLQKLGVHSQLAAVAVARRYEWSPAA